MRPSIGSSVNSATLPVVGSIERPQKSSGLRAHRSGVRLQHPAEHRVVEGDDDDRADHDRQAGADDAHAQLRQMLRQSHLVLSGIRLGGFRLASAHGPSFDPRAEASRARCRPGSTHDRRTDRVGLGDAAVRRRRGERAIAGRHVVGRHVPAESAGATEVWEAGAGAAAGVAAAISADFGFSSRSPLGELAEVDGVAQRVGRFTHLAHRLVGGVAELLLEPARHLLQLRIELAELAHRLWQLLGTEHHEGQEQDDDQLTALEVEHAGSLGSLRGRRLLAAGPSKRPDPLLPAARMVPACNSDSRPCSRRRSRSPTGAPRRTHRRTPSRRSNWRWRWGRPASRATCG